MGKVDQLDNAVNHGIAQGDNGNDRAIGNSDDKKLNQLKRVGFDGFDDHWNIKTHDRPDK